MTLSRLILNTAINGLSYGLVGSNINLALQSSGVKVSLFPVNEMSIDCEPHFHESTRQGLQNAAQDFYHKDPCVRIYHQFALGTKIGHDNFYVGFPIFELDKFSKLELAHLQAPDMLIVCSKWAKQVCENNGLKKCVAVVPLGVDRSIFHPTMEKNNKRTVFLACGKFEIRKSHLEIISAFNRAFDKNDKVELWIACDNCFLDPNKPNPWEREIKHSPLASKIRRISRLKTQNHLNYIYNQANFLVSPSKAEGWNLPALECMAAGTIPILTDYSAHKEYATEKNSFLIKVTNLAPAEDGMWFKKGGLTNDGNWLSFGEEQMEQLIESMRTAHKLNLQNSDILINMRNACLETAKRFSWENTANLIIQHLT